MSSADFEDRLADFLGGEMSAEQRASFEASLRGCPADADRVRSLSSLAEEIRGLAPARPESVAPALRLRRAAALRYAAVIVVAFVSGYVFRAGTVVPGSRAEPAVISDASTASLRTPSESLTERFVRVAATKPGASTLSQGLLAIGRGR